jgi:ankyrin repeat protein
LDHGASVEEPENVGGEHTALQAASYWATLEVMQTLLEYGADANRRRDPNNEELPLNLVLKSKSAGKKERVILLLDHGADVTLSNYFGKQYCIYWLNILQIGWRG